MSALELISDVVTVAVYVGAFAVCRARQYSRLRRVLGGAAFGALLFTPILVPATIALAPFPLGIAVALCIFAGCVHELPSVLALAPHWNLIAAMCTASIAACITWMLLSCASRNSAKPSD